MENLIYEFITENFGLNGWDYFTSLTKEEKNNYLKEIGFYNN